MQTNVGSLAKPRATVIALTGAPDSPLGQTADICLHTVSEELNYRFDAILTRLVQYGVVGVLFVELAVRQGDEGIDRLRRMRQSLSHLKY
jgi:DNA-binding MurR/RpiR family transcriptional regulator